MASLRSAAILSSRSRLKQHALRTPEPYSSVLPSPPPCSHFSRQSPALYNAQRHNPLSRFFSPSSISLLPSMPAPQFRDDYSPEYPSFAVLPVDSQLDMAMKDSTPMLDFDQGHFDSPFSDSDQMLFPLDMDDNNHQQQHSHVEAASPWSPTHEFGSPHGQHSSLFTASSPYDMQYGSTSSHDDPFDADGLFKFGLGDTQSSMPARSSEDYFMSQWVNDSGFPKVEPSSPIPIPISLSAPSMSSSSSFQGFGSNAASYNASPMSPTTFAAMQPLPRSASPGTLFGEGRPMHSSNIQSISPSDINPHITPAWATDLYDAPQHTLPRAIPTHQSSLSEAFVSSSFGPHRPRFPLRRDSSAGITLLSTSAPTVRTRTTSHPSHPRPYSRRAESVSVSDDRDATVRRKKRIPSPGDGTLPPLTSASSNIESIGDKDLAPTKSELKPPKLAPSAWQLYFTDWIQRQQATNTRKLNVAQAAKEAGQQYANLSTAEKEPYRVRSQALKEQRERELEAYMRALTPDDIKRENLFRAAQRKAGKSRKSNIKDPNAPKKPLSAYFMFLQRIRSDPELVKEVFGDESETTKQSVLAAAKWRSMTDDERKPFLAQAEQEKLDYEAARRVYEEGTSAITTNFNFSILPGSPAETVYRKARRPSSGTGLHHDPFSSESESEGVTDDPFDRYIRS